MPPTDLILNVAVGGILTGLIYGLMALGLSVIYGVIRVVNFAHGEMMTIAIGTIITSGSSLKAANSVTAMYMAIAIISPCAKLTTRITPKITDSPSAISP